MITTKQKLSAERALLLFIIGLLLSSCSEAGVDKVETYHRIQKVGKLDLAKVGVEEIFVISGSGHTLTSLSSLDDVAEYLEDLLRVGSRIGVYSFTNYWVAYLTLTDFTLDDVEVDVAQKRVAISLPPIIIEPIGRSGELNLLHERVTGTKRSITNADRTEMQNKASALTAERFKPGSENYERLRQQAEAKAKAFFRGYLRDQGYEMVEISVER